MNNSIKLAFVAALAVVGIAACTSAPAVVADGYGGLKLGMSLDEARAAGLTTLAFESDRGNECVADDRIAVSRRFGIERISLPPDAKTSKGIGVGSTFGDVKKAYPTAAEYRPGLSARIDDHAFYSFQGEPGSDANKVVRIELGARDVYCSMAEL
jgi:hypothetical protein